MMHSIERKDRRVKIGAEVKHNQFPIVRGTMGRHHPDLSTHQLLIPGQKREGNLPDDSTKIELDVKDVARMESLELALFGCGDHI